MAEQELLSVCCGANRNTPYCPMCGKAIAKKPLDTLIIHLTNYRNSIKKEIEDRESLHRGSKDVAYDICIRRYKQRLKKWQGWLDAIYKLIEDKDNE